MLDALGIGAASFASGVSKDIAESPTACRNAQRKKTTSQQDYKTTSCWGDVVFTEKNISCGFVNAEIFYQFLLLLNSLILAFISDALTSYTLPPLMILMLPVSSETTSAMQSLFSVIPIPAL